MDKSWPGLSHESYTHYLYIEICFLKSEPDSKIADVLNLFCDNMVVIILLPPRKEERELETTLSPAAAKLYKINIVNVSICNYCN